MPSGVPSLVHSSRPLTPSSAVKNSVPPTLTSDCGSDALKNLHARARELCWQAKTLVGRCASRHQVAETADEAKVVLPAEAGKLIVQLEDTLLGKQRRIPVDMVVLSPAMKPRADARDMARLFNLSTDKYGFFMEKHPKLAPIATMTDGVFIAGACQSPKDIPDTVAQATGAAAEALTIVVKDRLELEATVAYVNQAACCGCRNCVNTCPFGAPFYKEDKGVSEINEALCKGCGLCAAGCPTGAILTHHFANDQICLLYTSPSPRDRTRSRMPSSA